MCCPSKNFSIHHYGLLLVAISFLITSTTTISQDRNEIALPDPGYFDDEIVIKGKGWRTDDDDNKNGWREKVREEGSTSRIKYGYDPSYEETQERYTQKYNNLNRRFNNDNEIDAPVQIRFNW